MCSREEGSILALLVYLPFFRSLIYIGEKKFFVFKTEQKISGGAIPKWLFSGEIGKLILKDLRNRLIQISRIFPIDLQFLRFSVAKYVVRISIRENSGMLAGSRVQKGKNGKNAYSGKKFEP